MSLTFDRRRFLAGASATGFLTQLPRRARAATPFAMQGILNWAVCSILCVAVSLLTARPPPEHVTDQLAFNWRRLNIFDELGTHWYNHVLLWWGIFAAGVIALVVIFSGLWW